MRIFLNMHYEFMLWMEKVNEWKDKPIHRIYVATEHGLTSNLVEKYFKEFSEAGCKLVIDPFVGTGTVLIEAQKRGVECIGIDANPWALLVSKAKTTPIASAEQLVMRVSSVLSKSDDDIFIPTKALEKYYTSKNLSILGNLRYLLELPTLRKYKPLLLTLFCKIAERYSKLMKSPAPRFRRKCKRIYSRQKLFEEFLQEVHLAVNDLRFLKSSSVHLILADSTSWLPEKFDGILTSPPFMNNIDYIRHSQLSLYWCGLANDSEDLSRLRSMQLVSCEAGVRRWKKVSDERYVNSIVRKITGSRKQGYSLFVKQYAYYFEQHLTLLAERLQWQAWYTIGDSFLGGAYIPLHRIIMRLAKKHNLKVIIEKLCNRIARGRKLYLLKMISKG
ncbi:MAG: hypothetical protein DRJ60_06175 [Thermoprotei archaeon]|nr:MAG: hypothetical protein DRJ60_06175 [Thermoprotei archaeon]